MAHNFIQVGNSKAIIIPSKIIKECGYDMSTEFDIIETLEGLELKHKPSSCSLLEFPKLNKPIISSRKTWQLCADCDT